MGDDGDGGYGLLLTQSGATATVTDGVTITGGKGGKTGGGVGISGAGLTLTLSAGASVAGGLSSDGRQHAHAIDFTSGTNILELQGNGTQYATITGNVVASGSDNTLKFSGSGGNFTLSALNAAIGSNQFQGFGKVIVDTTGTWVMTDAGASNPNTWSVNTGTLQLGDAASGAVVYGDIAVGSGATLVGIGPSSVPTILVNVSGAVTVNSGGTLMLSAHSSAAALGVNALTLSAGSTLKVDLTSATTKALISVASTFSYNGALIITALGSKPTGTIPLIQYKDTDPAGTNAFSSVTGPNGYTYKTSLDTTNKVLNLLIAKADLYWNGSTTTGATTSVAGGNGIWSADATRTNWTGADGKAHLASDSSASPIFAGTAGTVTVSNTAGAVSVAGLKFVPDGYVIAGDTLTLASASGTPQVSVPGEGFATISAVLAGTQGLEIVGGGKLILTGENTYTGGTTITKGALQIGDGGKSGSVQGDITNNAKLVFNRSDDVTFGGAISGTGMLQKNSTGTLTLTGANTYSGETLVSAGTLNLTGAATFSGALTVESGATLSVGATAGFGSLAGGGTVTIAKDATLAVGTDNTSTEFSGGISGKGGLIKAGTGTLTVSGANTFTGGLAVTDGTVQLKGASALDKANVIRIEAGAILDLGTADVAVDSIWNSGWKGGTIKLHGNTLTLGGPAHDADLLPEYSGSIDGTGKVVKSGNGEQILYGSNTFTGTLQITGGTMRLASDGALSKNIAVTVAAPGTLKVMTPSATIGSLAGGGSVSGGTSAEDKPAMLTTGSDNTSTTFSGILADDPDGDGQLTLTKAGSGTLTLTGENTYTGGTTITSGTLQIGDGGKSGSVKGDITDNAKLVFNRADDLTYAGIVSGTGSLDKKGDGTLTLTGTHTYTGATTVIGGTLALAGGSVAGAVVVQSGGTLTGDPIGVKTGTVGGALAVEDGGTLKIASATTGLTIAGDLTLSGAALTALTLSAPSTVGAVSVDGNLTLGGSLNLRTAPGFATGTYRIFSYAGQLSGTGLTIGDAPADSLFSLDTAMNGQVNLLVFAGQYWNGAAGAETSGVVGGTGTWSANGTNWSDRTGSAANPWSDGALAVFAGTAGTVTVDAGAAPSVAAMSFVTDGYTLTGGAITLGGFAGGKSTRITVQDDKATGGGSATIASDLTGAGALSKQGAGTLTLLGTSRYTGATVVKAGTLAVSGSLASAVVVASGATLAGTGTVGAVTVVGGGTLAGVQGQTLTTGTLTLMPGAHVSAQLGASAGTTALFAVKGDLALNGVLDVGSATGTFGFGLYRLMSYTGTLSGNGLSVGTLGRSDNVPDATVRSDETAKTVDLVLGATQVSFWNAGKPGAGAVQGGDGTWNTSTIWTNAKGTTSTTVTEQATAIFTGTPGKVTVDAGAGPVTVGGIQFATSGYTVQGDALTLTSASTTVRVGDGTKAGASTVATIASPLSGTGGLRKTDHGTLVLTGANSFTGGTSVETGTLKVGHPQALGTGALSLNEGTTLAFAGDLTLTNAIRFLQKGDPIIDSGTGTVTIAGAISGVGDLSKIGSGTLILSGTETYTGATDVVSGTLVANGSLASSSGLTVESGATLGGSGTVPGVSALTGSIVAPGVATPYSTLNVAGSVSFAAGSTFRVQVDASGRTDAIVASGTATLSGGTVDVRAGTGTYTASQSYRILSTAGGLSGRFASLQTTTNLAFLQPVLNYDATGASLGFTRATDGGTGGSTGSGETGSSTAPGGATDP
ncbi:beta strand repeat-containing protein, partial [Methylobacterium persicinum]